MKQSKPLLAKSSEKKLALPNRLPQLNTILTKDSLAQSFGHTQLHRSITKLCTGALLSRSHDSLLWFSLLTNKLENKLETKFR